MKFAAATLAAVLLMASAAHAEDWADDPGYAADAGYAQSRAMCRAVKGKQPPAADRPSVAQAKALVGCSSENIYYGIGVPADPVKARLCAFVEAQKPDEASFFYGESMLMTAYANGVGAKRDLDLATHYACTFEGAPAETDGRVTHLQALKSDPGRAAKGFDLCDDITSGLAQGYCSGHQADIDGAKRDARLAALMAGWTPAERAAFAPAKAAMEAYLKARSEGEVDVSGTGRASFIIDAEEGVRTEFLALIEGLSAGKVPRLDYKAEDARLNAAYKAARAADPLDMGTVTKDGILSAQRAWLKYRDAFVAFAKMKFPGVSSDSVAAWMTRTRTKTLSDG